MGKLAAAAITAAVILPGCAERSAEPVESQPPVAAPAPPDPPEYREIIADGPRVELPGGRFVEFYGIVDTAHTPPIPWDYAGRPLAEEDRERFYRAAGVYPGVHDLRFVAVFQYEGVMAANIQAEPLSTTGFGQSYPHGSDPGYINVKFDTAATDGHFVIRMEASFGEWQVLAVFHDGRPPPDGYQVDIAKKIATMTSVTNGVETETPYAGYSVQVTPPPELRDLDLELISAVDHAVFGDSLDFLDERRAGTGITRRFPAYTTRDRSTFLRDPSEKMRFYLSLPLEAITEGRDLTLRARSRYIIEFRVPAAPRTTPAQ